MKWNNFLVAFVLHILLTMMITSIDGAKINFGILNFSLILYQGWKQSETLGYKNTNIKICRAVQNTRLRIWCLIQHFRGKRRLAYEHGVKNSVLQRIALESGKSDNVLKIHNFGIKRSFYMKCALKVSEETKY